MATFTSTVPFTEISNDLSESATPKDFEFSGVRKFWVAWNDRYTFINDLFGVAKTQPEGNDPPRIVRVPPQVYPIGGSFLTPLAWDIKGIGRTSFDEFGKAQFEKAEITITWGLRTVDTDPLTFASQSIDIAVQVVPVPGTAYKYASDNRVVPFEVGKMVGYSMFDLSFERVPYIDYPYLLSFVGTVNNAPFKGFPKGTLLYMGCKPERETGMPSPIEENGTPNNYWKVSHKIAHRTIPHNHIPRRDTGAFEETVPLIHEEKNFNLLLGNAF